MFNFISGEILAKLLQALVSQLLGFLTEDQLKEYAELARRFGYRAWDAIIAAALTWILAMLDQWRGGGGDWLQATQDPAANAQLSLGVVFAIITAARYVLPILGRAVFGPRQ